MSHQHHSKKIAGIMVAAGLFLSGGAAVASPVAEAGPNVCWPGGVAVSKTDMYDQAATTGKLLTTIPKGAAYQSCTNYGHTSYAKWPYWIQVSYKNTVGWVRVDQLYGAAGNNQQNNNQQQNQQQNQQNNNQQQNQQNNNQQNAR